jgi:aryl-alcohol dehydrogenase-like predicted oxidoreductase
MPMGDDPNQRGGSRKWIMREVENSLRRLTTDYIDLYQMHRPDYETDIGEAGMTLPQLATAFVRAHPAVTSVLIGSRTQEQLDGLLTGADIELTGAILDRIDEIVPPGTDLDPADNYAATPPAIEQAELRRR